MDFSIKTIGWIGTGVMGKYMCMNLIQNGFKLNIFNRTKQKTEELIMQGAQFLQPQQLASQSDAVILMLVNPKDVQDVVLGQKGILQFMKKGSYLIDHSTSKPSLAKKIFQEAKARQIFSLDAPVTGGDIDAKTRKLSIMVGGQNEPFEHAKRIFKSYSQHIELMGSAGKGQHTKMTSQIILAGNLIGTVEGLIYAYKNGLDLHQIIQIVKIGLSSSVVLTNLGIRMINRNFEGGFQINHLIKDLQIALEQASKSNLCLPNLSLVRQFCMCLKARNLERQGEQALLKVLQQMNNIKVQKVQKL